MCKVIKVIAKGFILEHMTTEKLLNPARYDFLLGRTTASQLISWINGWIMTIRQEIQTILVGNDYAKVFDFVKHSKLLHRLTVYGVSEALQRWLEATVVISLKFFVTACKLFANDLKIFRRY